MQVNLKFKHVLLIILIQVILIGGVFGVGFWKGWQKASNASSERIEELEGNNSIVTRELSETIELYRESKERESRILSSIRYEIENSYQSIGRATNSIEQLERYLLAIGAIFEYVEKMEQEANNRVDSNPNIGGINNVDSGG